MYMTALHKTPYNRAKAPRVGDDFGFVRVGRKTAVGVGARQR